MNRLRDNNWGYAVAFVAVAVAALARQYILGNFIGQRFPFVLFLFAVVLTAWIGGLKPGLSAVALGAVAGYFFFDPGQASEPDEFSQLRIAMFVLVSGLSCYWIERIAAQQTQIAVETRNRHQAETVLREREERMRLAVESADIGTWDLNVLTGERQWSNRTKSMFGLPFDEDVSKLPFLDLLHPDDKERTSRAIRSALDPSGDGHYEIDYRIICSDGTIRWVIAKGQAFFEGAGSRRRAIRFIGTVLDITDRKVLEEQIKRHHEVLKLAQSIGRIGHWEWNSVTDENKWSPEIEALYGLPPGGFEGGYEGWAKLVHPEDLRKAEEDVQRAFETGEYFTEFRVVWPDGSVHWLETRAKVFKDGHEGAMRIFGVNMDVTDRKRLEEELRTINKTLAKADRMKDEFLATLAHELRNPLTPISNDLQTWSAVEDDQERMEELRSRMDRQVRQMIRLIDDLMDVSRITSGKIELCKERIDLHTLISSVVDSIRPIVDANNHRLTVNLPAEPIFVDGDVVRLKQVFGNILNNAAKFTSRNGTISIVAEPRGDTVAVKVQDNGPGIPQEMLSEVFEAFRQLDGTLERSQGGLGIGLTLVKRFAEMHAGTVEAHSEGLGKGSEFVVTLPRLAAAGNGRTEIKIHALDQTARIPRRRILIVDDLPEVAESFQVLLEIIGQEVLVAHDGQSAIESVLAEKPDVVFLDIAMPEMNGYEVARQLRARSDLNGLTLVALTGYGQAEDQRRAREAGFDHHLTKPPSIEALRELLLSMPLQDEQAESRVA